MNENFYIEHIMDIWALSEKEGVDVGIGFEMFRAKHRAELNTKFGKETEVAMAIEYGNYATENYEALCQKYNTL